MTQTVIRHCAPTLAGIKAGSLFSCEPHEAEAWIEGMAEALGKAGLRPVLLRRCKRRALMYLYRPALLGADLAKAPAGEMLAPLGYDAGDVKSCVERLCARLAEGCKFPHEIGLFLGYPPEDVQGFVRHGGRGYKCCGQWKVYGDEGSVRRLFARFADCTKHWLARYQCGDSFEQLIAADGFITQ